MDSRGVVFVHTFIVPGKPDALKIKYHIYLMFLSYLSIRKIYPDVPFYLVTNSKSYEWVKDFPYTEILTSLDDYPETLVPSASKLRSIAIFQGQKFVHIDNDVFIFAPLPDFNDVLFQSDEKGFIDFFWNIRLKHQPWVFPEFTSSIKSNYNPGVFGFTADSSIRDEYYALAVEYHDKNKAMLEAMPDGVEKRILLNNAQDPFAMIEEGLAWYLVQKRKADLTLVIPDKYTTKHPWGSWSKGFKDLDIEAVDHAHYFAPHCEQYVHFMTWTHTRFDYMQPFIDRVYAENREAVNEYFSITV